jgi:serine/threonine-protein kinase
VSASEASSLIGRRLGRFRILSRIGQGGLATVWRAHDELLGRDVALKVLNETVGDAVKDRKRFAHEAQAASALDHSGIVTVFDAGESDGLYYIALTLIDGDTLSDLARSRLLPIDEAVRVVVAAADALAHAHSRGVFHRDVSGRNVMIARDGRVFVLDFGLALMAGLSRVTTRETTLGTVAYMAPEAWQNKNLDGRADVYGLGVVLFEALTGTYPHEGDRTEQMAFAKLNIDPRAPSELRPDVPPALDWIVARALARDPDQRYAGMQDMLKDLRIYGGGGGVPIAEERPIRSLPIPRRQPDPRDETQTTLPAPMYLTVLPFSVDREASESEGLRSVASRLPRTIAAAMSSVRRVRIVHPEGIDPNQTDREIAERVGANVILRGELVRSGARVRVTYALLDPLRSVQVGGGVVDGSEVQPFELEDAVIASVRSALGSRSEAPAGAVPRPPDPAAQDKYALALRYMVRSDHEASVDGAIRILEALTNAESVCAAHQATLGRACLAKWRLTRDRTWEIRAARICHALNQQGDTDPQTLLLLGEIEEAAGRVDQARAHFEAVLAIQPDLVPARLGLARLLDLEQRWDEAEAACLGIVRDCPDDWRAFNRLGLIRFHRGDYEGCVEPWSRVTELVPDSSQGHLNLGSAMYHLDRLADAVVAYRRALDIQPEPQALTNLGTALFYDDRHEEAVSALERAAAMHPSDPEVWGNLGNACRWVPGRLPRMREALERAVALMRDRLEGHPRDAEGRARLAGWLMNIDRREEALEEIRIALEMAPRSVDCMVRAGYVHAVAGDNATALRWFREAVRIGYGTRELERSPVLAQLRLEPEFQRILEEGRKPGSIGTPNPRKSDGDGRSQ